MNLYALNKGTNKFVPVSLSQLGEMGGDYVAVIPASAAGAAKVFFDLFNAETDYVATVSKVTPEVSGSVAVIGTLAVDLTAQRTSAIGTGGAAATPVKLDTLLPNIPANITVRSAPTGGATAAGAVGFASLFTEETNAGTYLSSLVNLLPAPVVLRANEGLSVVQGAVASVGNVAFIIVFSVEKVS